MKPIIAAIALFSLLVLPLASISASELPSCEDLTNIANALDELAEAFNSTGSIPEGGEVDTVLGDLVNALEDIAQIEGNATLSNAVANLADAYDSMDSDGFSASLEDVTVTFDELYNRDCT